MSEHQDAASDSYLNVCLDLAWRLEACLRAASTERDCSTATALCLDLAEQAQEVAVQLRALRDRYAGW